jgi:hypothetical protein
MKNTSLRLRPAILAASIAVLAASAPRAGAVDRYWNPVSGLDWFTPANWEGHPRGGLWSGPLRSLAQFFKNIP